MEAHGTSDLAVPVAKSDNVARALDAANDIVELLHVAHSALLRARSAMTKLRLPAEFRRFFYRHSTDMHYTSKNWL
jgi:hypothetical protein